MKVLALQGGGCLGYTQIHILKEIERRTGTTCAKTFGMIAGTSVGSILGAALSIGKTASEIEPFFLESAPKIFKGGVLNWVHLLWRPKYDAATLEKGLKILLDGATLNDCKTKFLATAFDWKSGRPVIFKSWAKSCEKKDAIVIGRDSSIPLWQVCRASAAAQTYFPGFPLHIDKMLVDGGNTGANAPDMLAITQAKQHAWIHDVELYSLGAGDFPWSERKWRMYMPSIFVAALNTLKLVFASGVEMSNYEASEMLGDNYHHIEAQLDKDYQLDDATPDTLSALKGAALLAIKDNPLFFQTLKGFQPRTNPML